MKQNRRKTARTKMWRECGRKRRRKTNSAVLAVAFLMFEPIWDSGF